ncbi:hypothetical protein N7532_008240 [Penicillium argentinense]|uniref:Uncharacterized protein n=1 Tax=Penicillium argentinense TaxID=1131581 RepID=A0A9W9EX75_9EURO|nr:uncharacterized protein N7532_008240 [Penicillium argentinense]KAJ5089556.1 hypothetical protein N7532_008240 [Penicillium argentinense]
MEGHTTMNSWTTSNYASNEQPMNSQYPGWSSNQPSPNRREHAIQPPLLTTALGGSQFHHVNTPLSTTSLSSPFTQSHSPYVASPANGRSASSSSSMASRQPAGYSVPYNPQDWGPMGAPGQAPYHQSSNTPRVAPQQRTYAVIVDETLSPPPPPYSPPSSQNRVSPETYGSPNPNIAVSSSVTPPQNPVRENDFDVSTDYQRRSVHRPRPLSMVYPSEAGPSRQSLPPPPPPQGHPGSRSVSQSRVDGYQGMGYNSVAQQPRPRISSSNYEQPLPSPAMRGNALGSSYGQLEAPQRPPASRRAASAGAVVSSAGSSGAASQSRNRSPSNSGWEPGMPLPPPPPGPPPTTASVSVSGSSESSSARTVHVPSRTRARPPVLGTGLGSIPPTPADWVDEEYMNHRPTQESEFLYVDTAKARAMPNPVDDPNSNDVTQQSQRTPGSGGSGLFRSSAIRDPSAKGIRERRIERRNRRSQCIEDMSAISTSGNPWADALEQIKPSNLVLPDHEKASPDPVHQPTSSRFTPQSSRSIGSDGRTGSRSRASSGGLFTDQSSSYTTPIKLDSSPVGPSAAFAHTPPFSPKGGSTSSYSQEVSQTVPPKALPTPPLNSGKDLQPRPRASSRGPEDRPISHILHMPNDVISGIKPLSPRRIPGQQVIQPPSLESIIKQDTEFLQDAMQRHRKFIEQEAAAVDENEALKLFTEFIIQESQIRRVRYAAVWESNPAVVEDVVNKLFTMPMPQKAKPVKPTLEIPQNRTSRPDSAWWNNYQPCLSPIASLSMSNDEMSSRGRAPSRWWESKTGSSGDGAGRRVQRSKRESKYMGLPRDGTQWDSEKTPSKLDDAGAHYTGEYAAYGPDEYPAEKVGWHEEGSSYSVNGNGNPFGQPRASQKLDISRLITLPPPYPRHYPAVNNSHPDLVSYRTVVRSITDLSEIKSTRQRYQEDMETMLQEHSSQVKEGRQQFKANIQSQIQEGSLTFAEAAEAEAAMLVEENRLERGLVKRQLDTYQETVLNPMLAILNDRIDRATACIDELSSKLFDDAQHETPDQTQEEGDEKPELLEKLTQLKWLFEAREQLHRESFDLVSDRDEKYKAVALLPYQQGKNEEKLRETQAFFSKDTLDRRVQYETSALTRLESFLDVIEQNVVRGVEVQLSAFWDIAPSLLEMVQQVPEDLYGFQVQIPSNEYEENPSYRTHPLQYLYSLLSHAEKSSYQYIESQTNLLCLLHEVRSALMRANRNLAEAERIWHGEPEENVRRGTQQTRADEELALTTDLKDKVATVEGQWTEALGSQIQGLRERVKDQLLAEDGWEDLERLEQE